MNTRARHTVKKFKISGGVIASHFYKLQFIWDAGDAVSTFFEKKVEPKSFTKINR